MLARRSGSFRFPKEYRNPSFVLPLQSYILSHIVISTKGRNLPAFCHSGFRRNTAIYHYVLSSVPTLGSVPSASRNPLLDKLCNFTNFQTPYGGSSSSSSSNFSFFIFNFSLLQIHSLSSYSKK